MLKERVQLNRADRISAIGRIVLAGVAAVAVGVGTPGAGAQPALAELGLQLYAALAFVFGILVWSRPVSRRPLGGIAHAVDVAFIAGLVYLTRGAASPFFPLFMFAILSATLRWNWRGALWTTVAVLALYAPTAPLGFAPDGDDLVRFSVRAGQIAVIGALLVYYAAHRERIWRELMRLARPVESPPDSGLDGWIAAGLAHAADFFGAERTILLWESDAMPGTRALEWSAGETRPIMLRPSDTVIDPALTGVAFGVDVNGGEMRIYDSAGTLRELDSSPLDLAFADRLGISQAIVTSIEADGLTGWLIVAAPPADERLYLARAIAVQLGAALDRATAAETWRSAAAAEERVRLARDLHDGILQTLTGLSLQLRVIQQEAQAAPEAAAERIARLEAALRSEQQELRAFIDGLRPRSAPLADGNARLATLVQLLSHQWDVAVDADGLAEPPPAIAADVRQIVREATANAVRHGKARTLRFGSESGPGSYRLTIRDDGVGFGRIGRFDAETLRRDGFGPQSLLARIDRLHGALIIETGPGGTGLDIRIPCPAETTP